MLLESIVVMMVVYVGGRLDKQVPPPLEAEAWILDQRGRTTSVARRRRP
jgi:hypothetical protein